MKKWIRKRRERQHQQLTISIAELTRGLVYAVREGHDYEAECLSEERQRLAFKRSEIAAKLENM